MAIARHRVHAAAVDTKHAKLPPGIDIGTMNTRTRWLAWFISRCPVSKLRCILYRWCFGYRIRGSRIGLGTIILVESLWMDSANIGGGCRFVGPMAVRLHPGVRIGRDNEFRCEPWTAATATATRFSRELEIGEQSSITDRHFFDVSGRVSVGQRSWIAGIGSQFWTHGAGAVDHDIVIGDECYLGSAVRFAPGAKIGNRVLVAMGSVVCGKFLEDKVFLAGVPARIIKEGYDWKHRVASSGNAVMEPSGQDDVIP